MPSGDFIAVDWGTTNRRIYLMRADGAVAFSERDDRGVISMDPASYPAEIAAIRDRLGALPLMAAGMVGSTRGWREVPYCDAPAGIEDLAGAITDCGEEVYLVPGIALRDPACPDVMRGEEVQVFGAVAAGLVPATALMCQPGTHNKWISVANRRIESFATAMTGELFSLLKQHSVLAEMMVGEPAAGPAFLHGVDRGLSGSSLVTALFSARSSCLLQFVERQDIASYVSGLLVGSDVRSRGDIAGSDVHLLASGALAELYATAIDHAGGRSRQVDSHVSFAAGIHAIWECLQ